MGQRWLLLLPPFARSWVQASHKTAFFKHKSICALPFLLGSRIKTQAAIEPSKKFPCERVGVKLPLATLSPMCWSPLSQRCICIHTYFAEVEDF